MLLMEALQWANEALKRHVDTVDGVRLDTPMLDAELLLASVLGVNKPWLFTHLAEELTREQEDRYHEFVRRRIAHEPVAYIVGSQEFYGREFLVNRFVLIPRPATETLVELALEALGNPRETNALFADIGTGSGAIGITLAAESGIPVIATDTSRQALAVARANAAALGMEALVDFRHGDLIEPIVPMLRSVRSTHPEAVSHLVVCANLPYLTERQVETGQRDVRDYEPREALTAGPDGLGAYWNLFRQLARDRGALPDRVTVLIEIDPAQRASAPDLILHDFPKSKPAVLKDLAGTDRIVMVELPSR